MGSGSRSSTLGHGPDHTHQHYERAQIGHNSEQDRLRDGAKGSAALIPADQASVRIEGIR